jgi:hypothetical protein
MSSPATTTVPASWTRKALAGLIDSAPTLLLLGWRLRRRSDRADARHGREGWQHWLRIVGPQSPAVHEQIGSPGEWITGLRTVDRRTGERVALWRTVALAGAQAAAVTLRGRLSAAPAPAERRAAIRELSELHERHADDPAALREAIQHHRRDHRADIQTMRPMLVGLALVLVNQFLRRRLAPTMIVRADRD